VDEAKYNINNSEYNSEIRSSLVKKDSKLHPLTPVGTLSFTGKDLIPEEAEENNLSKSPKVESDNHLLEDDEIVSCKSGISINNKIRGKAMQIVNHYVKIKEDWDHVCLSRSCCCCSDFFRAQETQLRENIFFKFVSMETCQPEPFDLIRSVQGSVMNRSDFEEDFDVRSFKSRPSSVRSSSINGSMRSSSKVPLLNDI
jgi:hypothetical protein